MITSASPSQMPDLHRHDNDVEPDSLLSLAIQESGTGVWDRNVVTGAIYYSPGWKKLLGYDEAELGSDIRDSLDRVHPDDRAYVVSAMRAHFDLATPTYSVEHRLRCKDGSYKWVSSQGRVVSRDENGCALRMVGTTIDITRTKLLAAQLQDAAALVRMLTDEIPGMVYQCQRTPEGVLSFSYVSAGARDIYEVEPEEAIRDAGLIFSRTHPEDLGRLMKAMKQTVEMRTAFHYEHRVILPKKGVRWLLVSAKPKSYEEGATVAWHGIVTDITDRKQNEILLNEHATIDFLTQLSNRRHFFASFEREIRDASVSLRSGAVLMCDLDHFKRINDTYGHPVGDRVLQSLAGILRQHMRKGDLVGRVGGEEFAVVLPGATADDAATFARRLQQDLAVRPVLANMPSISVTLSIGIAVLEPNQDSVESVLSRSDQALYLAKNSGRNRVVISGRGEAVS